MSKVLSPHKQTADARVVSATGSGGSGGGGGGGSSSIGDTSSGSKRTFIDLDALDYTSGSSIIEFLAKEQDCAIEADPESIFQEVSRLTDSTDMRSVDELLLEAERLIQQQLRLGSLTADTNGNGNIDSGNSSGAGGDGENVANAVDKDKLCMQSSPQHHGSIKLNSRYTRRIEHVIQAPQFCHPSAKTNNKAQTPSELLNSSLSSNASSSNCGFAAFVENLPSESVISEESTPKDMHNFTANLDSQHTATHLLDNTDNDEDTMEEITEAEVIETLDMADCIGVASAVDRAARHGQHPPKPEAAMLHKKQQQQQQQQMPPLDLPRRSSDSARTAKAIKSQMATTTTSTATATATVTSKTTTTTTMPLHSSPARRKQQQQHYRRNSSACVVATERRATELPEMSMPAVSQKTETSTNNNNNSNNNNNNNSSSSSCLASQSAPIKPMAMYREQAVGSSPKHMVSTLSSPIEHIASSITREHVLKHDIEKLQELLKDTEERLESVRVQNDSLSQMQRTLRDHNARLQEQSEMLKLDVQHLNECANVLRSELQAARKDRSDALELQKSLRADLEEAQTERRRAHEHKEKDARVIQDLQRQCREMERILMRKHPDSVSALIVASKNPGICALNDQENVNSRKLLEQRIAQLESDAKEQDRKAQQILANVQARFNSVQSKYETHIADLETQVLSLQQINAKLNEQIESQVRTLDRYMQKRADKYYNNCTQTENESSESFAQLVNSCSTPPPPQPHTSTQGTQTAGTGAGSSAIATRDYSTNTIGCPSPLGQQQSQSQSQSHLQLQQQQQLPQSQSANSSTSSTANSTPNTSRPNSKQSGGLRRAGGAVALASGNSLHVSKLPVSQSESTLSLLAYGNGAVGVGSKEESQLLSSVRGMRVDLAIKNKAMQRLTRELDECKKTIRKLQRDRESSCSGAKLDAKGHGGSSGAASSGARRNHDHDHIPATTESQALKEAQNKYRLLEADYRTLHDKRLHDLKTLQSAHERELASCNETVRILQQRLNEREEAFATQKRRKVPVDYYALKAKVSLLERRHSEREERLHMLVEALSKGRLNGALDDLLQENNNK
ncbi:centrosomal protein of 162 kDa [Scaptodrosophila lebanonensis]|uniref:Centrosomal protein of 162 kDa n=1 Tax=Drosophila lebanonensis TaxID=7225 RepID=A0A6J2TR59_DROLE|nr:centrosomal protein of 162 kDa [Scaptodrosophila lebanonensis]